MLERKRLAKNYNPVLYAEDGEADNDVVVDVGEELQDLEAGHDVTGSLDHHEEEERRPSP
jgi:hypothetical protein